jgi:hypothetical protein
MPRKFQIHCNKLLEEKEATLKKCIPRVSKIVVVKIIKQNLTVHIMWMYVSGTA